MYKKDRKCDIMKTRVITATVMIAAMIPFFWFSYTVVFPILMAFLAVVGVWEMQGCIGARKHILSLIPTAAVAAVMPFMARYMADHVFTWAFVTSFLLITYSYIVSVFSSKKFTVDTAALSSSTGIYISFGFASVVLLRDFDNGQFIFLLAFIIPWITDTFAYFCGRAFGKHKLIPEVSPKKTIEGSVGGTVCAVLITCLYGFLMGLFFDVKPDYAALAVIALIMSLISQCGDLIMSLVKRKFNIKDYGKIFPGHGGVLDRFDSNICIAPLMWILIKLVPSLMLFS